MFINIILCLIFGYVIGCFSTGYVIGKIKKVDIRKYGSGSTGTTNALRTLGAKAGAITLLGDMLKAVLAILIVRYLFFPGSDDTQLLTLYTGLGVVLGHNFPIWMNFKGGKGIAATGGAMISFDPWILIPAFPLFIGTVAATRYVSLGSLLVSILFPIWVGARYPGNIHMLIVAIVYTVLAFVKHQSNIKRLLSGTENKLGQKAKIDKN